MLALSRGRSTRSECCARHPTHLSLPPRLGPLPVPLSFTCSLAADSAFVQQEKSCTTQAGDSAARLHFGRMCTTSQHALDAIAPRCFSLQAKVACLVRPGRELVEAARDLAEVVRDA